MADRREKGLCFNCDQKFHRNHRCPGLVFLMVAEEDDPPSPDSSSILTADSIKDVGSPEGIGPGAKDSHPAQLNLNALSGIPTAETFRVMGRISNRPVRILVDGGSTHNFIQQSVAHELGLPLSPTQSLRVLVGNGQELQCAQICTATSLSIQGRVLVVDLFVLGLSGADVVLGAQWLKQLGPVLMDYQNLTMQFFYNTRIELRGDSSAPLPLSLNQFQKLVHSDPTAQLYSLRLSPSEADTVSSPTHNNPQIA